MSSHTFEIQGDIRMVSAPSRTETTAMIMVRPPMFPPGNSFENIILGRDAVGVNVEWQGNSTEASLFRCVSEGEHSQNVRMANVLEVARRIVRYANNPLESYAMSTEKVFAKPAKEPFIFR